MRRLIIRVLAGLLVVTVALPVASYAIYDLTKFHPRRDDIDAILEKAEPQDRNPPEQVVRMLKASEGSDLSVVAARLLVRHLGVAPKHGSMTRWHLHSALWWSLVRFHLTEQEQVTIVFAIAPTGQGRRGFTSTALDLYQRQPSDLSVAEVATVVALIRDTKASGERLDRIRAMLLERYANGA